MFLKNVHHHVYWMWELRVWLLMIHSEADPVSDDGGVSVGVRLSVAEEV